MENDKKYKVCHVNPNPFEDGYCDGYCDYCDFKSLTKEEAEARLKELRNEQTDVH